MNQKKNYLIPITIIGVLFFIFGFVTWLNGPLIIILQKTCGTTPFKASLVTLVFYIAYFFMALPSSFILRKTGYKNGMAIGLIIMAIGALLFIPASFTRMFGIFMSALFVLGTGLALLQTATNPYVTIIGPIESAAARISIMGICNKLAGVISPLLLTAAVMRGLDQQLEKENFDLLNNTQQTILLDQFASNMVLPYSILTLFLILFAVLLKFSSLPSQIDIEDDGSQTLKGFIRQIPSALKFSHLRLGVLAIFVYVGAEVIAGDSLTQFGKSLELPYASSLTSYTMFFMVLGYIGGIIFIPKFISQSRALTISAILGILITICAIVSSNVKTNYFDLLISWLNAIPVIQIQTLPNSVFFVSLLGLANALMWPAIWPLTLNNLGKYTKIASALLIMGIAGGALLPPLYAHLGQSFGFQVSLWILIPCYILILYFAVSGHKVKN